MIARCVVPGLLLLVLVSSEAPAQRAARAASDPRTQERASLMRYCDHVDSVSAPTLDGIRERTDCWKRIQLEGMGNALVDERYRAAVRDFDNAMAADSMRRSRVAREAMIDGQLSMVQQALASRELTSADSIASDVLAVQPQNQRALAFKERVAVLRRGRQLQVTMYVVAGTVLLIGLVLGVMARVTAVRQARAAEAERREALQRTALVRIIDGVGRGKMYTLSGPIFRIGSAVSDRPEEQNDLVLSDERAFVSRYHCAILRKGGCYYLIDSSLNGTSVDDLPLDRGEPTLLEDGSEFTLSGVTRLKFLLV